MSKTTKEASFYGPKFIDWLATEGFRMNGPGQMRRGEGAISAQLGPALSRRYNSYRNGGGASLQGVDRICMSLDLDINMIPDDVYKFKPDER